MKRILVWPLLVGFGLSQATWAVGPGYFPDAYPGYGAGPAYGAGPGYPRQAPWMQRRQEQEGPTTQLREAIDKLRDFMGKQESADKMKLMAFLETQLSAYFDFAYMTQWVAGPEFAKMGEADKAKMEGKIKEMFFASLSRVLATNDANTRLQFSPARPMRDNEVRVPVRAMVRNGPPVRLDFRFYRADKGWKIFDVIANNSSAVVYYRDHFNKSRG
jgi:ABC-type transporter MlaC component